MAIMASLNGNVMCSNERKYNSSNDIMSNVVNEEWEEVWVILCLNELKKKKWSIVWKKIAKEEVICLWWWYVYIMVENEKKRNDNEKKPCYKWI